MVFKWQVRVDEGMEVLPGPNSSSGTCILLPAPSTQIPSLPIVDSTIRTTGQGNQYPVHIPPGYTMVKSKKNKNKPRKNVSQPVRTNVHHREDMNSYASRSGAPSY